MDFLRRLFRGEQSEQSPASGKPPAPGNSVALTPSNQHAGDTPAADITAVDQMAPVAPPEPDTSAADAAERPWWEDSTPATDLAPPATATPIVSSDEPPPATAEPTEELSNDTPAEIPSLTDPKAPTEPLDITRIVLHPPASEENSTPATPTADTPDDTGQTPVEPMPLPVIPDPEVGTHRLDLQSAPALSSQHSLQGLATAALRDVGRIRQNNQDSVFAMLATLPREGADLPMGLFVVADGMGGHDGGEIASRLAVRTVAAEVIAQLVLPALDDSMTEALQPLMVAAVQEANRTIWDHAQSIHSDMGTTCTAVLLLGQALYIAHVGDSRAYLLETGGLRALTDDHSAVGRLIQLGQLDPAAAREHPLRSQLYRTIGQQPDVQVDFIYQPFGGSSHLLLCSDGLWGMISEEQIHQALTHHTWPQDACRELIALANLAGGEDNISAIVVTLPIAERPT